MSYFGNNQFGQSVPQTYQTPIPQPTGFFAANQPWSQQQQYGAQPIPQQQVSVQQLYTAVPATPAVSQHNDAKRRYPQSDRGSDHKRNRTDAKDSEIAELLRQLAQEKTNREEQKTQNAVLEGQIRKYKNQEQEHEKLKKERQENRVMIGALRANVESLKQRETEYKKKSKEFENENAQLKIQVASLTEKNDFVQKRNETLLSKCERLQNEFKSMTSVNKEDHDKMCAEFQSCKEKVEKQELMLKAANIKSDDLEVQVGRLRTKVKEAEKQKQEAVEELEKKKEKLELPTHSNLDETDEVKALKHEAQIIFSTYRSKLESAYKQVDDLKQKFRILQADCAQQQSLNESGLNVSQSSIESSPQELPSTSQTQLARSIACSLFDSAQAPRRPEPRREDSILQQPLREMNYMTLTQQTQINGVNDMLWQNPMPGPRMNPRMRMLIPMPRFPNQMYQPRINRMANPFDDWSSNIW